jgi:FkbM family methyltransferase
MIRQINAARFYDGLFEGNDLTFVDLGANLGMVSLFASPRCRKVLAVEPEPMTYTYLSILTRYAPKQNIDCMHVALAPKSGTVQIAVDNSDFSCHTVINPKLGSTFMPVMGMTLLEILEKSNLHQVDICKVDTEGAEMGSLTEDSILDCGIPRWYIEVHKTPQMPREKSLAVMLARLKNCGFTCTTPRPNAIIAKR